MLGELAMGTAEQSASWTRAEECIFKAASTASAASELFLQCDFDIPRIGVTENWQYVTSQARSSGEKHCLACPLKYLLGILTGQAPCRLFASA